MLGEASTKKIHSTQDGAELKLSPRTFLLWCHSAELCQSVNNNLYIVFDLPQSTECPLRTHTPFNNILLHIHTCWTSCTLPGSKQSPQLLATELLHSSSWQLSCFDQKPVERSCWRRSRCYSFILHTHYFPADPVKPLPLGTWFSLLAGPEDGGVWSSAHLCVPEFNWIDCPEMWMDDETIFIHTIIKCLVAIKSTLEE